MLHLYQNTLLELFARITQISANPDASHAECLSLQETLIKKITYVERKVRLLRHSCQKHKAQLRSADPAHRLTSGQAAFVKAEMAACKDQIAEYQRLLTVFREIGDCVAFIYIEKYNIKPMAFKESSGFLSGKKGARFERKLLRYAFAQGQPAILNDLTNCLRYGDLTLPVWGMPYLIEVKSGRGSGSREDRQRKRLSQLYEYFMTDRVTDWYDAGKLERRSITQPERDHRPELNELMEAAYPTGGAFMQVEEGLHYLVEAALPGSNSDLSRCNDVLSTFDNPPVVAFVNELKQQNFAYYPFPLTIAKPEHILGFYNGEIVIMVMVDTDHVHQYFASKGMSVEFKQDADWCLIVRNATPSENQVQELRISNHFWGRLFAEFLSLRWMLDEINSRTTVAPFNLHPPEELDESFDESDSRAAEAFCRFMDGLGRNDLSSQTDATDPAPD